MNQVTLIGTIVGHPRAQTDRRQPKLSFSLKTEEIRCNGSNRYTTAHIHQVQLLGDGLRSHLRYLQPGVLVAVNGTLHSQPDNPIYVLAAHLDVLSEAEQSENDVAEVLDIEASETRRLDDDSTARVSYDGHTRKV